MLVHQLGQLAGCNSGNIFYSRVFYSIVFSMEMSESTTRKNPMLAAYMALLSSQI